MYFPVPIVLFLMLLKEAVNMNGIKVEDIKSFLGQSYQELRNEAPLTSYDDVFRLLTCFPPW